MPKTTTVTSASNGVTFTVRLVERGDHYGRNFCRVHAEDRPMVEFYDVDSTAESYDFVGTREEAIAAGAPRLGQFASSYYVHTLLENIATTGGSNLRGHVPRWTIDGNAVRQAFQALGLWSPADEPEGLAFFEDHGDVYTYDRLCLMGVPDPVRAALRCITKLPTETYTQFLERCMLDELSWWVKIRDVLQNLSCNPNRRRCHDMNTALLVLTVDCPESVLK